MAGRIRTIKPELLEDAVTAGLSDMALRIFIASILLADDYGRLRAEPGWLMGQIYWARTVQVEEFIAALGELAPLMNFYAINGQRYAVIRNWSKHQKVSHPGKPRIPEPPEGLPKPSGESRETLVPDLRPTTNDQRPRPTTPTEAGAEGSGLVAVGTAGAAEARAAFQESVAQATGKRFALARAPFHDRDLVVAMNTHGPPESVLTKIAWLRETVAAWVLATDPKYAGGWAPTKLLDWLNADRPDRAGRKSAAEITKQPFDPDAPWMKLGDTGS